MSEFPKLNSEYFDDIKKQIREAFTKISDMTKEKNSLDRLIRSGNYAGQKLHDMSEQRTQLGMNISREREEQQKKIKALCDEFVEELRKEDDLNPRDVKQDDWNLITTGINYMTARDLQAMIDRNSGNRTMLQLILRCAKEHNRERDLNITYQGNSDLIQNVNIIPDLAKTILRYDDADSAGHIYNEILGDGSNLANMFSPDND